MKNKATGLRSINTTIALLAAMSGLGCSNAPDELSPTRRTLMAEPKLEKTTHRLGRQIHGPPQGEPGSFVTDNDGVVWSVTELAPPRPEASPITSEMPLRAQPATAAPRTDAEVAEGMRMIRRIGNREYREVSAVSATRIAEARARNAAGQRLRVDPNDPTKFTDPTTGVALRADGSLVPEAPDASAVQDVQQLNIVTNPLYPFPRQRLGGDALTASRSSAWSPFAERTAKKWSGRHTTARDGAGALDDLQSPMQIFGTDTRVWQDSNYGWPRGAIIKVTDQPFASNSNTGGSGTLIGSRTAVFAAHSWYINGAWRRPRDIAVDYIHYVSWSNSLQTYIPYDEYLAFAEDYDGWGCFSITLSNDWASNPDWANYYDAESDIAVVEFLCDSPGYATGWIPPGVGSDSDINNSSTYLYGYDYATNVGPLPNQSIGVRIYQVGSMLGRNSGSGVAYVAGPTGRLIFHTMDASAGSSGGGLLKNLFQAGTGDPTYYWSGLNNYETAGYNGGLRSDWLTWSVITARTSEY